MQVVAGHCQRYFAVAIVPQFVQVGRCVEIDVTRGVPAVVFIQRFLRPVWCTSLLLKDMACSPFREALIV
jgi:hypothetical protein